MTKHPITSTFTLTYITEDDFDALRAGERAPREVLEAGAYFLTNVKADGAYAWSPDGVGCIWFNTLAELMAEHA